MCVLFKIFESAYIATRTQNDWNAAEIDCQSKTAVLCGGDPDELYVWGAEGRSAFLVAVPGG